VELELPHDLVVLEARGETERAVEIDPRPQPERLASIRKGAGGLGPSCSPRRSTLLTTCLKSINLDDD
jgi:hypothetical protein